MFVCHVPCRWEENVYKSRTDGHITVHINVEMISLTFNTIYSDLPKKLRQRVLDLPKFLQFHKLFQIQIFSVVCLEFPYRFTKC